MNVIMRGAKNALRSPLRAGAIVLMLAVSIGLILAMLVARSSVEAKISEVKASTASDITVSPAGMRGGLGSGDALTAEQVASIAKTAHVTGVTSTLTDQLGSSDTNLTPSLELGNLGQRMQRFEGGGAPSGPVVFRADGASENGEPPKPRTSITGTNDPNSASTSGGDLTLTSGNMIDGTSSDLVALVGTTLASKNNLSVGSTFTAYGQTVTVKGIFETKNMFQDSGIIMPIATLQNLTSQPGAVSSAKVHVNSSENVKGVVDTLTSSLGSKADVTSEADRVSASLEPLQSISGLAFGGVIAATVAGASIILLAMIMIVRERRREIGVIKAIGGTNFKVITQFMTEAMTLTIIGGIVGLAIGIAASGPITQSLVSNQSAETRGPTLSTSSGGAGPIRMAGPGGPEGFFRGANDNLRQVTGTLTPQVFAASIGITLLIAIIGSAVPAWLIARIRPAEVLRTE